MEEKKDWKNIFIDNYEIKKDIVQKKEWFIDKIKEIYGNQCNKNNINQYYIQSERNAYVSDKRKIDNMIEYLNNQDKKGNSGCFS